MSNMFDNDATTFWTAHDGSNSYEIITIDFQVSIESKHNICHILIVIYIIEFIRLQRPYICFALIKVK